MNTAHKGNVAPPPPKAHWTLSFFSQIFLVFLFFLSSSARITLAQTSAENALEKETHAISESVLSPFCPGRSLNDCPSSAASDLRHEIYQMLSQGKSREEVLEHLYALYGNEIRATPALEGFGMVGWLMPAAFLLMGALVLAIWLSKNSTSESSLTTRSIDPEVQARVDAELSRDSDHG